MPQKGNVLTHMHTYFIRRIGVVRIKVQKNNKKKYKAIHSKYISLFRTLQFWRLLIVFKQCLRSFSELRSNEFQSWTDVWIECSVFGCGFEKNRRICNFSVPYYFCSFFSRPMTTACCPRCRARTFSRESARTTLSVFYIWQTRRLLLILSSKSYKEIKGMKVRVDNISLWWNILQVFYAQFQTLTTTGDIFYFPTLWQNYEMKCSCVELFSAE